MTSSLRVILLGLFIASGSLAAQPQQLATAIGARRIELMPDSEGTVAEVMVSPGLSTMLLFDSPLSREGLELEGRGRFALVDVGHSTIRVVPSAQFGVGESFQMSVVFQDGASPVRARFLLRVHPAKADVVVEVFRGKRTIETYQQEAREARAEAMRCQEENVRLRAERVMPGGLAGLVSTDAMDDAGVLGRVLTKSVSKAAGNVLLLEYVKAYRAARRAVLDVRLFAPDGVKPWLAKGAAVRDRTGEDVKVLHIWQSASILAGESGRVVVEFEVSQEMASGPFSLKLWEADGPRTVALGNIALP
ncbi:DUF2381 family protein [Myxococcus stipitatus]|uniref:DUF2381 family protein n=1 Tax=Myxococcus stipitatus TaxID=83455 RepID=UPI0011853A60|nr:DUF2381 family protein [Myxococcus stipitatus]